ncbi:secretory phospholipase A2 receptor-like [Physella acuta]|uniref:secretory phospholipase A2 receptor-like n=1 Tax=Physella acuta TaxID=109671 RepID=UPI0027DDCD97|nr:secretory phospholipase A2 receptor-like [Physella acuta]XP_059165953.1 secretory phospholipase A2 receptor-like [Physella acuta]XP_059165955.1 secretory phospholipase A2 receptor-like [Physella acuta]XP_059165956.1 secretory phospholipase A2 receptor-like [Physella acuta]
MKLLAAFLIFSGIANAQDCGAGWVKRPNTNFCYYLEQTAQTYNDAMYDCVSKNGILSHVLDQAEQDFTYGLIKTQTKDVWLGLTDMDDGEGTWRWTAFICIENTYWDEGQPSYGNGGSECAVMKANSGLWDDMNCEEMYPYICKKKLVSPGDWTYVLPTNLACSDNCKDKFPFGVCVTYDYRTSPCVYQLKMFDSESNGVTTYYVRCTTSLTVPTTTTKTTTAPTTKTISTITTQPTTKITTTVITTIPTTASPRQNPTAPRRHQNKNHDSDCEENSRFEFSHPSPFLSRFGAKGRKQANRRTGRKFPWL